MSAHPPDALPHPPQKSVPSATHAAVVDQLRRLEFASLAEGTTLLLLLFVAVPLKHLGDWPIAVQVVGPVHGLAFLSFIWITIQTASVVPLRPAEVLRLLGLSLVPFGGYLNGLFIARKKAALQTEHRP